MVLDELGVWFLGLVGQVYQASCLPTTRAQKPEQYKIETQFSTGAWMWRFDFYAFPAPQICITET
jgi:hypothetical protein